MSAERETGIPETLDEAREKIAALEAQVRRWRHLAEVRATVAEREYSEAGESIRAAWRESERREQELRDRLIAAERERDNIAAALNALTAEHAASMVRVREAETIITGRTKPPTDEEIVAHSQAHRPGLWVTRDAEGNVVVECGLRSLAELRREQEMDGGGVRWISIDTVGRPCAWPDAVEGAR